MAILVLFATLMFSVNRTQAAAPPLPGFTTSNADARIPAGAVTAIAAATPSCTPEWGNVNVVHMGDHDGLRGVDAIADNDVWAVGVVYTGSGSEALAEHWDGFQ